MNISITERDIAILLMIYFVSGCAISHIQRRFFSSGETGSSNACYRRVQRLAADGWIKTTRLPSVTGMGAGHLYVSLDRKGRQLVAEHLGLSRSELQRVRAIDTPYAATHHFAIVNFRLALELACERTGLATLEEWTPESQLRIPPIPRVEDPAAPPGAGRILIPLIADGEFRLRLADGRQAAFKVEVDLGTVPRKRLCQRLRGQLVRGRVDERPILWVVPDEKRQAAITEWAQNEARSLGDPTIIWTTTSEQINESTILTPIWQIVGGPRMALVPPAAAAFSGSGSIRMAAGGA